MKKNNSCSGRRRGVEYYPKTEFSLKKPQNGAEKVKNNTNNKSLLEKYYHF